MKRINANTPNEVLLNVVRNNASLDYRNRIPVATQGNSREILAKLQSYRPDWNEFVEVLLNVPALELYRAREIDNPLAGLKRAAIRPGSWVKEIGVGLVQAHSYDKDATNVFGRRDADVRVNFHYQNRKDKYVISVSEDQLAQAFYDETGLASFVNMLMMSLQNSDNLDEYLIMRNMIKEFDEANPLYNVQVPDFVHNKNLDGTTMTPDEITSAGKTIARQIRAYGSKFRFANRAADYNAEHLPTISRRTRLFCTPEFLAAFDVEILSYAFNIDRTEVWGIITEVDDLGIEGAQAILADEDWFVCVDTLLETRSAENPDGLFRNYFLHHWGVYSISRFLPAVLFSTRESTDMSDTVPQPAELRFGSAPTVIAGSGQRVAFTVLDANGAELTNEGVSFEFVPAVDAAAGAANVPTSTNTFVEAGPDGYVYIWVGSDETAPALRVKGTCVDADANGDPVVAYLDVAVETGDEPEPGPGPAPTSPQFYVGSQLIEAGPATSVELPAGTESIGLRWTAGDSATYTDPGLGDVPMSAGPSGFVATLDLSDFTPGESVSYTTTATLGGASYMRSFSITVAAA